MERRKEKFLETRKRANEQKRNRATYHSLHCMFVHAPPARRLGANGQGSCYTTPAPCTTTRTNNGTTATVYRLWSNGSRPPRNAGGGSWYRSGNQAVRLLVTNVRGERERGKQRKGDAQRATEASYTSAVPSESTRSGPKGNCNKEGRKKSSCRERFLTRQM